MKTQDFLSHLQTLDIKLSVNAGQLRCNAPKGVLTPDLQQELKARKAEILHFLEALESPTPNQPQIAPISRHEKLLLSFAQQRLWFLNQLDSSSTAYNIPAAYRLLGSLNIPALEQSFREIIRRHDVLRTTFFTDNGQPYQAIRNEVNFSLSVTNVQALPETEREAEVQRLIYEETREKPFDLVNNSLLRANLLCLGEQEHILVVTMHHIISDGWSMDVLTRELSTLYQAFTSGQLNPLPDLPIQYVDFATWQREWLQGEVLEHYLDYWRETLQCLTPLELPTDSLRPTIQTSHGQRQSLALSPGLTQNLKRLSQRQGTTLFMTLLAAFKLLLSRLAGQDDIVVGSPVAGRNRIETESLIGFFINTVVLRTNLSGQLRFSDLLDRVRKTTLDAYAYQEVPFEKLVEELQPERDLSRSPLFQVWVNMFNPERNLPQLPGLNIELVDTAEPASKFDLTLYIAETSEQLHLKLVFNATLFSSERMSELLRQYEYLLQQVVEAPDCSIDRYSLVTPETASTLPDPSKSLNYEPGQVLYKRFVEHCKATPQRLAVIDSEEAWSYDLLNGRSNQLAHYLNKQGLQPQDIVAIYASRSANLVCAILGVLKAGAGFLILDPSYPAARLIHYLQIAQPKAWIALESAGNLSDDLAQYVDARTWYCRLQLSTNWHATSTPLAKLPTDELSAVVPNPEHIAYTSFTSGSTGQPKGILGTHSPVFHFLDWYCQTFTLTASDRFSLLSGLSHDPLLRDIFTPLSLGATLHIPSKTELESPSRLIQWMQQSQISVAHLTPAMGALITKGVEIAASASTNQLPALRYACFGGDVLTRQTISELRQLAPQATCVNFYGATETPQVAGYFVVSVAEHPQEPVNRGQLQKIPIGQGIDNTQLLVLNASQKLAGIGEVGEIYVRTPYLSKGYVNDSQLNFERFVPNPLTGSSQDIFYRTGDLARYFPNGNIDFLGRSDDQVKLRGFRIELGEIEAALSQHPLVQQYIVVAREDEPGDKRLIAYIVALGDTAPSHHELRHYLQQMLPDYMIPSVFVIMESFPLTPNGKVNRRALPQPEATDIQTTATYIAPRTLLEQQLADIWAKVLKLEKVGIHNNFFELGGHSLIAVQLFYEIEKLFGRKPPLAILFQAPTINDFAEAVRLDDWAPLWSPLVPIQPKGNKPSLFCIHPIGGNVLEYELLARHLGAEQPVYGLQAQGLDGNQAPLERIEDMATLYINEIRRVQSEGPYFLAGYSFGGLVAFEMAQQLYAQGQKDVFLALLDRSSPNFQDIRPHPLTVIRIHLNNLRNLDLKEKLEYIQGGILFRTVYQGSHKQALTDIEFEHLPSEYTNIIRSNIQAIGAYTGQVYPGNVNLFRCQVQRSTRALHPDLGWGELVAGELDVHHIPGLHNKLLSQEASVQVLADKLRVCLEKHKSTADCRSRFER